MTAESPAPRLTSALADRYHLERELGQGGMATVYLAEDLKHGRKVAIKVLRPELAAVIGADRFLREIKTIANLQHPHILGLIDSGEVTGTAYYVMPFVEGESLRDRLAREKQLPIADEVRIATEVAGALDYAHRHGVIHRDVKPENVMLHDGSALVADFGIALAVSTAGSTRMTETGMSLGTPTYMSPEQAMGEREITARSDIYALGVMTYEMLVGEPPFTGPTAQAIIAKVMTSEPASLTAQRKSVPPAVEDAVLTALEKLPADRWGSAAEFAAALTNEGRGEVRKGGRTRDTGTSPRPNFLTSPLGAGLVAVTIAALAFGAGRWAWGRGAPAGLTFLQRSYRDEAIYNARFAPDGRTIVYSSAAGSSGPDLFVIRPEYPVPTGLGLTGTQLLSVSSKGELAVLVRAEFMRHRLFQGTLARVPLGGGAPREVLDSVREADWSPDGTELAIIHDVGGRDRLEFPIGTVLYQASGYLSDPRVSPDGRHVAFAEHPFRWDDRGLIRIVDRAGKPIAVSSQYPAIEGMAWLPGGHEVLFSAAGSGSGSGYFGRGLTLTGAERVAVTGAGILTMQDVSRTGQVLLTRDDQPFRLMVRGLGTPDEIDMSWLDVSLAPTLSRDGSLLAFTDGNTNAGPNYAVMLRGTGAGQVVRLGEGESASFSPDGKWLLAFVPSAPPKLLMYPTRTGSERPIPIGPFESIGSADWFPDGQSVLFCGNRVGEASRCYVQPLAGGTARPVTPAGTSAGFVSPDGKEVVAFGPSVGHQRYPVAQGAGPGRDIPGLSFRDQVVRWSTDGRALIVGGSTSSTIDRLDLATGRRQPLVTLGTQRPGGRSRFTFFTMADDPHVYAYIAATHTSEIFTVDGVQ